MIYINLLQFLFIHNIYDIYCRRSYEYFTYDVIIEFIIIENSQIFANMDKYVDTNE